jgi:tRNA-modifying protein YgfZ
MTSSAYFPSSTHLFELTGPDARDLLHRITTTDVRGLGAGDFRSGFFLNPQGKVRAAFRIACRTPDSFYVEVEGGKDDLWKTAFLTVLDQFTFAEKYTLTEVSDLANAWIFGLPKASDNRFEERKVGAASLLLFQASKNAFQTHWTSVWGNRDDIDGFLTSQACNTLSETEFEKLRIESVFPRIDHELLFDSNPLEIGMRDSIADNKGCYPGQEVIEKIVSLGSPAKRLALLSGSGAPPALGSKVQTPEGQEVAVVTSSTRRDDGNFSALAVLRKNVASEGKKLIVLSAPENAPIEVKVESVSHYE